MPDETPFNKLNQRHHEAMAARADASHEESRVMHILRVCNLNVTQVSRELCRWNEKETGTFALTFRAFHERFPSFPMYLGASRLGGVKLHTDPRTLLPSLYKSFTNAPFVEAFYEWRRLARPAADGRTIGLIVPRNGMPKGLIIHGPGLLESNSYRGVTMTWSDGEAEPLYLRSYADLILAICQGWAAM